MFLLHTVAPAEATDSVAQAYATFPKEIGVPRPLQLASASPKILDLRVASIRYFMSHPKLSPALQAAIRFVAASKVDYKSCVDLNGGILTKMGVEQTELADLAGNPAGAPLEDAERAMLAFVGKAMDAPTAVTPADIQALRDLGYADADIMDAMTIAGNMVGTAVVYKTFVRD